MNTKASGYKRSVATLFTFAFSLSLGLAASVDWGVGSQSITGDSDVSTAGTLVDAFALGDSSTAPVTVNGVTFAPFVLPVFSYSDYAIIPSATNGNYTLAEITAGTVLSYSGLGYTTGSTAFSGLSANYQALLANGGGSSSPSTLVLTINGLTVGQTYQFEWWDDNSSLTQSPNGESLDTVGSAGNSVTLLGNDGTAGSVGHFAIGTFTADSTTQEIDFDGIVNSGAGDYGDPTLNAFQLRDLSAVPEPSSFALLLPALLGGVFRRRKMR